MNYSEMQKEIKAGLPRSLYIFVGEEDFLKEKTVEGAAAKLIDRELGDFNYFSCNEMPEFDEVNNFVNTLPLMSARKLLVLRRCGFFEKNLKQKSDWEAMFKNLPDYICVILWEGVLPKKKEPAFYKAIKSAGETVEFPLQVTGMLVKWLAKAAGSGGKLIDSASANYIIQNLGRSMSVLKTEMEKITAYAKGEQITRADIDAVIITPIEDTTYKMMDAVIDGRRDLCYNYLEDLKARREQPISFLTGLSSQIILTYQAKLLLNDGCRAAAAAQMLKSPFVWLREKCVRKAAQTTEERLERLIRLCRESDRMAKSGLIDQWAALELIISEMKI